MRPRHLQLHIDANLRSGMTPEVIERIRKPYFTTREGGTGLGVAVARGLVEQHGGRIAYESSPGVGTTVSIDLPRCALLCAGAQKQLPKSPRSGPVLVPEVASASRATKADPLGLDVRPLPSEAALPTS